MDSPDHHYQQEQQASINSEPDSNKAWRMDTFKLYSTEANYYIIGCDEKQTFWKVLKINRLEPFELNITEDSTTYSEAEHTDLLQRIEGGNKGGFKLVSDCYGIVGFVKFLGPYYMLLITKRREIGRIDGHAIYAIDKRELYRIPSSDVVLNEADAAIEERCKKHLNSVNLRKDFFFSYTYHVMLSLQKNQTNHERGIDLYETMFVWNEFLTREIRNQLNNTLWTVALVHGFFKQVKLSIFRRDFWFTLIARRSRHYAGTRYLKRGVNEKGHVANDVETEQIVFEIDEQEHLVQMSSVVQIRGSIPLFWSQEASILNLKPAIILSRKDPTYNATKLHFENLVKRYGNPVIILNLIKMCENTPRESILRTEFAKAIACLNRDLAPDNHLKFLHWDLNSFSRNAQSTFACLVDITTYALDVTGFFYHQIIPNSGNEESPLCTYSSCSIGDIPVKNNLDIGSGDDKFIVEVNDENNNTGVNYCFKSPRFQKGILRTNCIDCLDRTNVAQYAYGLVALAHQLHALGFTCSPTIYLLASLADDLMTIYEEMGDTLALQYGGSPAHNKFFSDIRGHWKPAARSQEIYRCLQRYMSNNYMDGDKQKDIDVFLGYFSPRLGKESVWEHDSNQPYKFLRHGSHFVDENSWSKSWECMVRMQRSLSDGNIPCGRTPCVEDANDEQNQDSKLPLTEEIHGSENGLSESSSEMSISERDIFYSRYTSSMSSEESFQIQPDIESDGICFHERGEPFNCSNFLDDEWLSSPRNSCEGDICERSTRIGTSSAYLVSYTNGSRRETSSSNGSVSSLKGKSQKTTGEVNLGDSVTESEFSETFANWVTHGDTLVT